MLPENDWNDPLAMKFPFGITLLLVFQVAAANFASGQNTNAEPRPLTPAMLDWPPVLDTRNTTTKSVDGRTIERFIHGPRETWGYKINPAEWVYPKAQETAAGEQNHNSFYLVWPKQPHDNAPLCVVLHSANRTGYDYLGYSSLDRKVDASDDPPAAITRSPDDFYALYLNSTNDEWWGWHQVQASADFAQHVNSPAPAEKRVLDTIEWVANKYHIDRNRIYLCGVSMGGCGGLGIGMPHGDIFAAMRFAVPAGTEYAAYRTNGFALTPAQPDPPVLVDFSSQTDGWSKTQDPLVLAAQAGRLPLVLCWGPFGHTGSITGIGQYPICQVPLAFPWLEIRKNEAYPVFTRASCDQRAPWPPPPGGWDDAGQTNAWFRWKTQQDTPSRFAMQLWIAHPEVKTPVPSMPDTATADVTFRRLQQFKIQPDKSYTWKISRDGKAVASGKAKPDASNLLTIPQVSLTTAPCELSLQTVD
jgi:hypothetical protein